MSFADLPVSVLFLLFLFIFTLVRSYPAWMKAVVKIRQILKSLGSPHNLDAGMSKTRQAARPDHWQAPGVRLNSYENLVFRRLAQSKGLSRKQLAADLHLAPASIKKTLLSLNRRGFVQVAVTHLLGVRFSLTEKGRTYAVEKDVVPSIQSP